MLGSESTLRAFQILALVLFVCALLHTFLCTSILKLGKQKIIRLLGEVELVFVYWSVFLLIGSFILLGPTQTIEWTRSLSFVEPFFVFSIMLVSASAPILSLARSLIPKIPAPSYFVILGIVPLLGSLITEPAAMTIAALLVNDYYFSKKVSDKFRYLTLGILFVNVSIGGTLTHFAAPPILMVTAPWNWSTPYLFAHFGWKSTIACTLNAVIGMLALRHELKKCNTPLQPRIKMELWVSLVHLVFLILSVIYLHHPLILAGLVLFFIGFVHSTRAHQSTLKFRDATLVALFLAGLVVIGTPQEWWLTSFISALTPMKLGLGSIALTAVTDNAALTYLGTLIPNLSDDLKYALVTGAVTGGGLTIIANAPNPVGFQILKTSFKNESILALKLLTYALLPTFIAWICLWYLPTIRF